MLDLLTDKETNWLPRDGEVYYAPDLLTGKTLQDYFTRLLHEVAWQADEVFIYGRHIITDRQIAWYANRAYAYRYSNHTRYAHPWTETLLELKALVEDETQTLFNACLLNLYHHGQVGLGWHSDDEETLKPRGTIASLSLGAKRRFVFRHKHSGEKVAIWLEPGSLLRMQGVTQQYWLHSLPKMAGVTSPRINLTFRQMKE